MECISVLSALDLTTADSIVPIPGFHEAAARERLRLSMISDGHSQTDYAGDLAQKPLKTQALKPPNP